MLDSEGEQFPNEAPLILYLRACMAARVGPPERAESILAEALDRGYWFNEMTIRQSPSWKPLQGRAEFERLAAISIARAQAVASGPERFVAEPAGGFAAGQTYPLLIALHGNGDNGRAALAGWRSATEQGWLLVALQSSQIQMPNAYIWEDQDLALSEIATQYHEIAARYPVDPRRVVVVGFSMGGEIALRLALRGTIPQCGLILLGPGGPTTDEPDQWSPEIANRAPRPLRSYVLLGDRDRAVNGDAIRSLVGLLNARGIPSLLEELPGYHHEYPHDGGANLGRALAYVVG